MEIEPTRATNRGGNQQINVSFADVVPLPKWFANLALGYFFGMFVAIAFLAVSNWNIAGELRRLHTETRLQAAYIQTLTAELQKTGGIDAVTAARMQVLLNRAPPEEDENAHP